MKAIRTFIFCFFLCFNFSVGAQEYDVLYLKLEKDLLKHNSTKVILSVDSLLLQSKLSKTYESDFKALKMEAMMHVKSLSEALNLSEEILKTNAYSERAEVRLRIQRALVYEYFNQEKATIKELNRLSKIYIKRPKDRYYGQYLYRKSSYYRVLQPVLKSDSLALKLANEAAYFGDTNKYYKVSGTAKMLQSFFVDINDNKNRIRLLEASVYDFKLLKNSRYVSMIYAGLSKYTEKNGDLKAAIKYLDSSQFIAEAKNDLYLKRNLYNNKADFFERIKELDSTILYLKKFQIAEKNLNLEKENLKVAQVNFDNQIDKERVSAKITSNELETEKKSNKILLVLFFGIIFLLISVIILYQRLKRSKRVIDSKNEKLKLSIKEKELLLKELNHRVKNNLSLIISLIKFQSEEIKDTFYVDKFNHLENRISSIAIAHEQFVYSDSDIAGEFYDLEEYLNKISESLINVSTRRINFKQNINTNNLTVDTALPIGILMNELISNSIEHAKTEKVLKINLKIDFIDDWITISYKDSGTEFKVKEEVKTLGLFIIDSMIAQLEGTIVRQESSYTIKLKKKL